MTHEYKTLAELDVKPGDVVCSKRGCPRTVLRIAGDTCYFRNDFIGGQEGWDMDGAPQWRIVSRAPDTDATDSPTLWRDMTPEEKGALLLAEHEGKVIEKYDCWGERWGISAPVEWLSLDAYRVRPEPETRTIELFLGFVKKDASVSLGGEVNSWAWGLNKIVGRDNAKVTVTIKGDQIEAKAEWIK
jgi:hypothetical protein